MKTTEAQIRIEQKAINTASAFINNNEFDSDAFEQNYSKGASADNVYFGYQFGKTCADMLTMKSLNEIKDKTPALLKILSKLNDSEFEFSLECFKNRMNYFNPYYSENSKLFNILIKEAVANTELANHTVIQNIIQESKEKVINNISNVRENSGLANESKMKNI